MRLKTTVIELIVMASTVGMVAGLLIPTGDHDFTHHYPPAPSGQRTERVDVAGEYYLGDGLGTNLRLSILPDGRYSLISSGCTGVFQRESGHVREVDDRYMLSPT